MKGHFCEGCEVLKNVSLIIRSFYEDTEEYGVLSVITYYMLSLLKPNKSTRHSPLSLNPLNLTPNTPTQSNFTYNLSVHSPKIPLGLLESLISYRHLLRFLLYVFSLQTSGPPTKWDPPVCFSSSLFSVEIETWDPYTKVPTLRFEGEGFLVLPVWLESVDTSTRTRTACTPLHKRYRSVTPVRSSRFVFVLTPSPR